MTPTRDARRWLRVLACCAAVAGCATRAAAAPCTIDGGAAKQAIDGFGFASVWSGRLSAAQNDILFGTGSGQLGFSLLRVRIDPTRSWADETANAAAAHARGAKVLGSPWSPPASMKTNNNVVHGSLRADQYAAYASYLNQAATSIGLDWVSLQNEPDWDPDYEGCTWTAQNFLTFMLNNAGTLSKPIVMPEALGFNDSMSDPSLNNPTAAARIGIVAGHLYGNGNYVHTNALNKGKRVWMTEYNMQGRDIATGLTIAKQVSDAMNNQFSAYFWWWVSQGSQTTIIDGTTPRKTGYALGQFARVVRPGMTRIGTTYNPSTNVYVTAYRNGSTVSIVAVNTGSSAVSQQFTLANLTATSLHVLRTSGSENLASVSAAAVSNGSFTYNLPAQSITSFSGPIGGGTTYALSVTRGGTGSGTVTSSVGGINCGATCSATLASGTAVTLIAAAASGSTFTGWSGACTGSGTCIVTLTAAQAVTATFTADQQQPGGPVSINAGGAATGTFVADVGFSGGSTYATTATVDTSALASPAPPAAIFQSERYGEFTYTITGLAAGSSYSVTLYFAETYWTTAGQRTFDVTIGGATVLTAFDIFTVAGSANKAVARTFPTTADASGQVVIAFTRGGGPDNPKVNGLEVASGEGSTGYSLSVTRAGTGTGTVAGGPISCGTTCSASGLASGTTVTLTATPATGSTFAGWSGACSGTGTCVVSAAATIGATFTLSDADPTCKAVTGGQSGNFNTTGATCFTVTGTIYGWGCSNADGRTVTVNGTAVTCGKMPLPGSTPYTFSFGAGTYPWASFYWW